MTVTLELPDPKFKIGDIVQIDNEHNDKHIYFKVEDYLFYGTWGISGTKGVMVEEELKAGSCTSAISPYSHHYTGTCEPDSWKDCLEPIPLEGFMVFDYAELELKGKLKEAA